MAQVDDIPSRVIGVYACLEGLYMLVYTSLYRCQRMAKTKLISMRIDENLHKKAKNLGLNITKVCENALRDAVARLEGSNTQTNSNGSAMEPRGGFEPPTTSLRG